MNAMELGLPIFTDPQHWLPIENAGGQQGYADRDGRILIAPRYHELGAFCAGLALASVLPGGDEALGYIGSDGQWQIAPRFSGAGDFAECGLAPVSRAHDAYLSGYCDRSGALQIAAQFDHAGRFDEHGMARVQTRGLEGYIDASGGWRIAPHYPWLGDFAANGLARACDDADRVHFINRSGDVVLTPALDRVFDSVFGFGPEGLAMVVQDGRYGFIDHRGSVVVAPHYADLADLRGGLARVEIDGRYGFINRHGALQIAARFGDASSFMPCGLAIVSDDAGERWGCINAGGELVIPCVFEDIQFGLHPTVLEASRDGCDGYIDLAGRWLFERTVAYG
ncbi:WG repeat-containing protein [Chitinibacteraceae bacterium HSL-7]